MMLKNKHFKFKKLFSYLSTFCFVTASGSASALYDAYPSGEGPYDSSSSENQPWSADDASRSQDAQLLACTYNKSAIQSLNIHSGCLSTKALLDVSHGWQYGGADNKVFRVVAHQSNQVNHSNQYRAKIKAWQNSSLVPLWAGLHAFARYQTSGDLYLASIRYDGNVTIKVKYQGSYTTLAQTRLTNSVKTYLDEKGHLATGQWYKINFSAVADSLTLSLDGIELLSVNNDLLSKGKIGIRTDYVQAYLDDWQLMTHNENINELSHSLVSGSIETLHEKDSLSTMLSPIKVSANHGEVISYNGHPHQDQHNPTDWQATLDNSWCWEGIECEGTLPIKPDDRTDSALIPIEKSPFNNGQVHIKGIINLA